MDVTNPSHPLYGILQSEVFPTLVARMISPAPPHDEVVRTIMVLYETNTLHGVPTFLSIAGWAFVWANNVEALKKILDKGASFSTLIQSVLDHPWYDKPIDFDTIKFLREQCLQFDDPDASKFLPAAMHTYLSRPFSDSATYIKYIVEGGFPKRLLYDRSSIAHLAAAMGNVTVLELLVTNGMRMADAYWGFYGAAVSHNVFMMEWFIEKGMSKRDIMRDDYVVFLNAMRAEPTSTQIGSLNRTWDMVDKMGIVPAELAPHLSALVRAAISHRSNALLEKILTFFGDRARQLRMEADENLSREMSVTLQQWGIIPPNRSLMEAFQQFGLIIPDAQFSLGPTRGHSQQSMTEAFTHLAEQFYEARVAQQGQENSSQPSASTTPPISREEWTRYNYRMFCNTILKGDIDTLKRMRDIKVEDIRRSDIRVLCLAATSGSIEVFRYLWNQGCTIEDLRSNNGELLDIAVHHGHLSLLNLFREYGFTYEDANAGAFSSYLLAQTEGSTDVIEIFESWNQVAVECEDLEMTCGICLDALISTSNNILIPTVLLTTRCNHSFHQKCIKKWMDREKTCPTCRDTSSSTICYKLNITATMTLESALNTIQLHQKKLPTK